MSQRQRRRASTIHLIEQRAEDATTIGPQSARQPIGALYTVFAAGSRGEAVRAALGWLLAAGFERGRFYALAAPPYTFEGDPDPRSAKLVLVALREDHDGLVPGRFAWPAGRSLLGE